MPCLYLMEADLRGNAIVKFGISADDEPWQRNAQHRSSRDNPLRERIALRVVSSFRFDKVDDARLVESTIRSAALVALLRAPMDVLPSGLCVLIHGRGRLENPSGEWLVGRLCPRGSTRAAVSAFYNFAISALDDGPLRVAHPILKSMRRAAAGWEAGSGYSQYVVSDEVYLEPEDDSAGWVEDIFPLGLPEGFM